MVVAEQNKLVELAARREIPDEWAGRGHCPACGANPLKVLHLPGGADYLLCPRCELSFEVAQSGGAIRIKNLSEKLEFAEGDLRYRWVQPSILPKLLENRAKILQEKVTGPAPKPLSADEVWNRMLSLHRLGNTPKMIQFTLIQAGATPAQAEAAFVHLKKWTEQEARRQTQRLWRISGATFLLILSLVTGTWAFTINRINAQLADGMKNPSAQAGDPLPLKVLQNLPENVKPGFLKSPAAEAVSGGPAAIRCPVSAAEAARIFGGSTENWKMESATAWQMVSTGDPITIRVPAKMYAGYIDNKSFNFLAFNGPATIYHVNFVAIACE